MQVKQLTKRYGDKAVVDGVDLEIPQGKVTSFIGPNGCLLYTSDAADD